MTDRSFCVGCDKFGMCALEPLSRHCTLKYKSKDETFTINTHRVRALPDEELAALLERGGCPPHDDCWICDNKYKNCVSCWFDWLQSPDWELSI